MESHVLPAKLSRPRLFDVVPRERLFAVLDDNRGRPLMWVAGPPGAGKTTLAASWLEAQGLPCVWYQVDHADTDPAAIHADLARAAEALAGADATSLPSYAPEHATREDEFARLFFDAFWARLPGAAVLVFDNWQDAPAGSPLPSLLCTCLQRMPPGHSVLVLSREEAPPAFVEFAARGTMITLTWDRLQVTEDEAAAICARRSVTEAWLVQALHRQSHGWVAGITLMLERIGHAGGGGGELPSDTRESVFRYFASLIFRDAPAAERHALLSIAFLPRVATSAAVALSGNPEAPAYLDALYRRRLFIDRRPGPVAVYQFHALFLDFLRERARTDLTAEGLRDLVARTARSLEGTGDTDDAMTLWLDHDHPDEATRLLLASAAEMLRTGRRRTLLRWIDALPATVATGSPWIACWRGRALQQTDPAAGSQALEVALRGFHREDDRIGALECLASLVGGAHVGFHAMEAIDAWVDALAAGTEAATGTMPPAMELRARSSLCVALFHTRPLSPLMQPSRERAEALLATCDDPDTALQAALAIVMVSGIDGDFARADRVVGLARTLAERPDASPSAAAWCLAHLGYLRYMEARYEEALEAFAQSAEVARANGLRGVLRSVLLWRHLVVWRLGQAAAADACVAEVEAMTTPAAAMPDALLELAKARQAGDRGHAADSARFADRAWACAERTRSRVELVMFGLACADAQLAAGHTDTATRLLLQVRTIVASTPPYAHFEPATTLLEAWRDLLQGDRDAALRRLRDGLTRCREGSARHFLRLADRALPILSCLALEQGIERDLVRDIIRLLRLRPPADAPDTWPWPVRIRTLGRFDVEVDGASLEFPRKVPRKALLLLKAIVARGGRDVPEAWLCDQLWGDEDGDAAANALGITVIRLRRLLGSNEALVVQGARLSLDPALVWIDALAFERHAAAGDASRALALWGGVFLPDEPGEPWSVPMRERLRGRFIDLLSRSGAMLEATGDPAAAVDHYLRGIDADPVVEAFHQGLMRCYIRLGRDTEAVSAYRRLRQTLSATLGVPPCEESRAMQRQLLARLASTGPCEDPDAWATPSDDTKARRNVPGPGSAR